MNPRSSRRGGVGKKPENVIRDKIVKMLTLKGWYVLTTHGNMYQSGFPDIFATHRMYGARWIEIKRPDSYSIQDTQMDTFPKLCANGSGVWILVDSTEIEYRKLFAPANWYTFIK